MNTISICPDCRYEITEHSPRSTAPEPARALLRLRADLDEDTRAIFETARRARIECATWPSWKHGRCNCDVTAPKDLIEVVWDPYDGVMSIVEISLAQHAACLARRERCSTEDDLDLRNRSLAHALLRWPGADYVVRIDEQGRTFTYNRRALRYMDGI